MLKQNLTFYTFAHLCVDMVCAWGMFFIFLNNPYEGLKYALVYNFFAFAFQPAAGIIADKIKMPQKTAAASFLLLLAGILMLPFSNIAAAAVIGIGNSFFHISGGIIVYNLNPQTSVWQGVYISSGGIGLGLGALGAQSAVLGQSALYALLILLCVLAFIIKTPAANYMIPALKLPKNAMAGCLLLILLAIVVRSIFGLSNNGLLSQPWQKWTLIFALATGKAAGGFLIEKAGILKGLIFPLVIVMPLMLIFDKVFILFLLAGVIIQMSTAITLYMLFILMPKRPGLAFGLNCLALFAGFCAVIVLGFNLNKISIILIVFIFALCVLAAYKRLYAR